MCTKRITIVVGLVLVVLLGYIGYSDAVRTWQNLQDQKNHIEQMSNRYQELNEELDSTKETEKKSQEQVDKLEQEKKALEEKRSKLEAELQAKLEAKAKLEEASKRVVNTATLTTTAYAAGCGDNQYAAYIYGMESGGRVSGKCNPSARNASGCFGIGQDCNGVLEKKCGANYECQNKFFTEYATRRYGSWERAYLFWTKKGWW